MIIPLVVHNLHILRLKERTEDPKHDNFNAEDLLHNQKHPVLLTAATDFFIPSTRLSCKILLFCRFFLTPRHIK